MTRSLPPMKVTTWDEFRASVEAWMPKTAALDYDGIRWLKREPPDPANTIEMHGVQVFARCPHCERVFAPTQGEALIHICPVSKQKEVLPSRFALIKISLETA